MATTMLDPYATLGIPPGASHAEAMRAHRRLAKQFHPDVNPGPAAAERMRRINEAWRILSNPARRTRYDSQRATSAGTTTWAGMGPTQRAGAATWTTWPEDRVTVAPRARRPVRPEPVASSFGDRPIVLVAVWLLLGGLYFIGTWLGSLAPAP
jgi:curved DNA-binding protein CbpA